MIDEGNYKILHIIKQLNIKIIEMEYKKDFSNINTVQEYMSIGKD
jgi:molybdopterin-guanine dinucleotide biosynthesis protein A